MNLSTLYRGRLGLSFELFPPKTAQGEETLIEHLRQLAAFRPDFVTCTYGAGGSTRDKTLDLIARVKREFQIPVASHLTCVGATTDELRDYLSKARSRGIDAIVALRGDPAAGDTTFQAVTGGLRYANELVALVRAEFPGFGVAVAGYPETHREASSAEVDLENLKRKVETGADIVITQLFFDNRDYFQFRERCDSIGIRVPIVPGILPVTNLAQIQRITSLCGARLPAEFVVRLGQQADPDWQHRVGVEFATAQVSALIEQGAPGVHFYLLNKSQATREVLGAVSRQLFPESNT